MFAPNAIKINKLAGYGNICRMNNVTIAKIIKIKRYRLSFARESVCNQSQYGGLSFPIFLGRNICHQPIRLPIRNQ